MKASRIDLRRITLLLILVGILTIFAVLTLILSQEIWLPAGKLADALANSNSVALVEFERDTVGPELVFSRVAASPQQIEALLAATDAWLAPMPSKRQRCFSPHHRIEVVRPSGSVLRFEICFQCENFALDGSRVVSMPAAWRDRLAQVFTAAGMPPCEDYSALAKSHPDYHLVEEARAQLEKAPTK